MQFLLKKIATLNIDWNRRPLTEEDFYLLCKRYHVTVEEMPLRVSGFYYFVLGKHCIAIDRKLPRQKKLLVMFHEFAHFLMHAPESGATANYHGIGRRTRKEREADAFALCALIPKTWITSPDLLEMVSGEFEDPEILAERVRLFETFGI